MSLFWFASLLHGTHIVAGCAFIAFLPHNCIQSELVECFNMLILSRHFKISPFFVVVLLVGALFSDGVHSYATPELNRRAMAGLWRLVTTNPRPLVPSSSSAPMKEFTTYPKKSKELLLMLNEDGSFQEYHDNDDDSTAEKNKKKVKGTWDFLDGQLILATDRRSTTQPIVRDTILVGKVVASQDSLNQNSILKEEQVNTTSASSVDTHLSVPQGSFKVGKYFYPKNHPSFFEQPIFRPTPTGSFQLRQVLGSLNALNQEEKENLVEKFRRDVFFDKTFYLTSHPIQHKPKGHLRWSIKYNKFVEDTPRKQQQQEPAEIPIRVMEVAFFQNYTFSTIAGLGEDTVLRGKWDIIGQTRNQLWMQVWRFGFGRSVSGSVYSEGKGLSKHDEKTYWGEISYLEDEEEKEGEAIDSSDVTNEALATDSLSTNDNDTNDNDENKRKRLQVKGSVMYGWGLEPQPVARFIMKESRHDDDVDEDEIDEEEEAEDRREEDLERTFNQQQDEDDDIDWSNAFQ